MPESTFSGTKSRHRLDLLKDRADGEFLHIGSDVFNSEELSDLVYRTYLTLLTDGWRGHSTTAEDIGLAYLNGFYIPCCERLVLAGQIDLTNDTLPAHAGVVLFGNGSIGIGHVETLFVAARRTDRFPRQVQSPPFTQARYICTWLYEANESSRVVRRLDVENFSLDSYTVYFAVMPSGAVVPCYDDGKPRDGKAAAYYRTFCQTAAAAINSVNDSRHVWNVATSDPLMSRTSTTPLVLGVSEEHVKSLFYARALPVTESGRRRSILHWVRAHQRRIKAGIDIDVQRHLRGISAFEMDGFSFEITSPRKSLASRLSKGA